ncbi:hypothetical protein SAMN06298216_1323 [Spirosomataceae bacterium TFI 002]|nr:hypothetical protein SAMN06298216_1323 [Spirosomataceae bacterium TFI 002]
MMSYKWNSADAKTYAKAFSQLICSEYFNTRNSITGSEILKLTEIKQLNLMIVRVLYEKWQEETARLKSPYFDFDNEEVNKAFKEFKNILSRNISVKKDHFEEVLNRAVYATLELNLSSQTFFEGLMKDLPEFKLTQDWLKLNGKYFVSHNWVLAELLNRLQGMPVVYANQAIDWVKEILQSKQETPSQDLEQFDKILSIPFNENYQQVAANTSFFDDAFSIPETPVAPPVTVNHYEAPVAKLEPAEEPIEIETVTTTRIIEEVKSKVYEPVSFNDKHLGATKTLNEKILKEEIVSLSDNHSKGKITSIRSAISLNQRFLFINNLFGGNVQAFTNAIDELEAADSFSSAKEKMLKKYLPQYKWEISSPEAEEFFDILRRRFN